ncbi:MAG TPA: fatty acid desaturase [Thermoanaerobaculia bacterium]|jgi:sphingolipid delta-4 desaturase|nr:fatty acid desaturase [Thermoanaerobaculia bacterium]
MSEGFLLSPDPPPHRERTMRILAAHPEVRRFIGVNSASLAVVAAGAGLQFVLAYLLRSQSWWLVVATAMLVGAFASHALWVMIHECTHNLLFRNPRWNTLAGIFANLPHILPSAVSFQRYHLKHHAYQGVYELDADVPNRWEARLIGHSPLGKAVWMLLFPVFQITRPPRLREIRPVDRWIAMNFLVQIAFDAAVWAWLGPRAFFYLLFSTFFGLGLHPLGARWIQEHYVFAPPQETYSYYGPLNTVAFNVGYHNEHHDFPSVPWNRLPRIRETAPEAYEGLVFHRSWTGLLLRFLGDPAITLFSREVRVGRGPGEGETTPV